MNQRVLCDERAVAAHDTDIVLLFINQDATKLANTAWGSGEDLVFVIEDPHCFQMAGDRSFYLWVSSVALCSAY